MHVKQTFVRYTSNIIYSEFDQESDIHEILYKHKILLLFMI